ncbi:hypothetical protein I4U23_019904 [Adineta vaga]|nr:hypothetical protein I4U23_019904 [Adineta vaga]
MRHIDWRSFLTTGILSICFIALCANRLLVFHYYGNNIKFPPYILFWIWIIITPDIFVLIILYILLFYIGWKYPQYDTYGILLGLCFAIFSLLVLSCNIIMLTVTELLTYYWKTIVFMSSHTRETVLNTVTQAIRAPSINISHPLVSLKKPIKHVLLIILESVRADTIPLNKTFAETVHARFSSEMTVDKVTPFLNSLWKDSVHTIASATSSYTLKSLVSIFCGIYPLAVNFLKETTKTNTLYEKCLPELLQETFQTKTNQSIFRSAIFTTARGDFDHQRELFTQFKFDTIYDASEVFDHLGYLPDVGMFGPADTNILPLLWKYIDKTLIDGETSHLFTSLLLTGTHEPFTLPDDYSSSEYQYFIDDSYANAFLNTLHTTDKLVKKIIQGFKSRQLYDETLFIIVSDHGYVFNDYGSQIRGLLSNPLESAFSVPLMFHNTYLTARELTGQFTTMDILPTTMDLLLSSTKSKKKSTNQLLSVSQTRLRSILSQYEGTSILRMQHEQQPVRFTFSLANPGNAFIIARQYPRKLSYDVTNDEVHLYNLEYDQAESIDLLTLDSNEITKYPSWIDVKDIEQSIRIWKGRWFSDTINIGVFSQILSKDKNVRSRLKSNIFKEVKLDLNDMIDWAEQTFELTRLWVRLIRKRYHNATKISADNQTTD